MKTILLTFATLTLASYSSYAHGKKKEISVSVTEKGFEPKKIDVKAGEHVVLNLTRTTDVTCAKQVQVPSKNIKITLEVKDKSYSVDLGKVQKGEIKFGCGMDMMEAAQIIVN